MAKNLLEQQANLPSTPVRTATAALIAPPVLSAILLGGFARLDASALVHVTAILTLLMVFSVCSADILAFPVNARGELGHRLEIARCAGTSWFADLRAEGRCALLEINELSSNATRQCGQFATLFAGASALHLVLGAAVLAGATAGRLAWTSAAWTCCVSALACAYFGWIAATYRRFGPVGPGKAQVLEAANLHLQCDQERRAELIGLVKKSL